MEWAFTENQLKCLVTEMKSKIQHVFESVVNFIHAAKLSIYFIVILVIYSDAERYFCHFDTNNSSSRHYYCRDESNVLPNASRLGCYLKNKYTDLMLANNSDVTELKITRCHFIDVLDCIEYYDNLISMDVSNSEYDSLSKLKMNHTVLTKFNASHNRLSDIPEGFFVNISEVIEIDFSYNNLINIDTVSFEGTAKLKRIHFAHNRINRIYSKAFSNLSNLEYLDLSGNSINNDIDTIFDSNNKLRVLHLEYNNPLREVPVIPSAVSLYISWKQISTVDASELGNRFHIIFNNQIEGYVRTNNDYTEFHCNENSFEELTYFTAGPNQIDNVHLLLNCLGESLEKLELPGNIFGNVNSTTFARFVNLEELILRNTQLKSFDFTVLKEQTALSSLDISKNNLKKIENAAFLSSLENLEDINVADNQLENIPEIVQYLNANMETMDLSGNFIGKVDANMFERFSSLLWLYLRNTSLAITDFDPFHKNSKLFSLDISYNNMAEVDFTPFLNTFNHLNEFHAVDCKFKNTTNVMKLFGSMVSEIDLSNNFVNEINDTSFNSNVKHLKMSNTNMTKFEITKNMVKLYTLDISHNQLTKINFTMPLDYIETIDVQDNHLVELINFEKQRFPLLKSLAIANNNFPCNYLTTLMAQIEQNLPLLNIIGNPFEQKHGEDCRRASVEHQTNEAIQSTSMLFYLMVIGIPTVVLIFAAGLGFRIFRKLIEPSSTNNYEAVEKLQNDGIDMSSISTIQTEREDEPIYEEIGPSTNETAYDKLRFGTDPMPMPISMDDHYHNAAILNKKINNQ